MPRQGPDRRLVTCIIPAKNESESIAGALQSILDQDYPLDQIEVVVVDGCSDDDTADIAKRTLDGNDLRRYDVVLNPDGRTPSNLNRGLLWAEGHYVVRVDARSRLPRNYVSSTIDLLESSNSSVVGGRQLARPAVDELLPVSIARALNNRFAMGGSRYRRAGASSGQCDTAYLGVFRTAQLREADGWSEPFATNQDFELNRRMASFGPVWFLDNIPVEYHPRRTLGELFRQYRRFGEWKVLYWQTTGDKPQPRQVALVAGPIVAALPIAIALRAWPRPLAVAAIAGALSVEHVGTDGPNVPPQGRIVSLAAMAAVSTGWWLGVANATLKAITQRPHNK